MSVATYTDGSYTVYGNCSCGTTVCKCGAVKHFPRGDTIEKYFEKVKIIYDEKAIK